MSDEQGRLRPAVDQGAVSFPEADRQNGPRRQAALLDSEKRIVLAFRLLMALVAIATFSNLSSRAHVPWQFHFVLGAFILLNVVIFYEKPNVFDTRRAVTLILTFDIGTIALMLLILGVTSKEFYLIFLLTIFVSALSKKASYAFTISVVMVGLYLLFTLYGKTDVGGISWPFFVRAVLFFVVSSFVGHLSEVAETRRQEARQQGTTLEEFRQRTGEALAESETRFRTLVEHLPAITYTAALDGSGTTLYVSPQIEKVLGISPEEYKADADFWTAHLHDEDRERVLEEIGRSHESGEPFVSEYRMVSVDGRTVWLRDEAVIVKDEEANPLQLLGAMFNITQHKEDEEALRESEEQFRQAQKMEAVGRLAGGVAHDFNNMLAAIIGYSDLMLMDMEKDDRKRADIENIKKCADSAASLTRQLLAFSRKQALQLRVLNLNEVVAGTESMLRRLIGEDIDLVVSLAPGLGTTKADPGQVEQVIMNLAVNARDAMPGGGRLTIETANVELDDEYAREHVAVTPGPHVMLAVSDDGCGMDKETQEKIFEPFFTTKEMDKGTGLGLSAVYGIVKQSGGNIWVYSEPGEGTTFKIYLPRVEAAAEKIERPKAAAALRRGTETILVVEDEDAVRDLVCRILRVSGYTVLSAPHGGDALVVVEQHEGAIDLIITDVVMPHMSGRELADRVEEMKPGTKVLFTSGYTDNAIVRRGVLDEGIPFIQKPYAVSSLLTKMREVLEAPLE